MKILLTDVCDFQGGTQPSKDEWINEITDGYIRMLQIRDFTQPDKNNIQYVKYTSKLKTCEKNDILIGRYGASVGKILTGLSGAYNVALIKTIPDLERLDVRYLFYYFNSQYFQQFIKNVGSRAAQAGFNKGDLNSVHIPLISLEEQRKIAEILDKVSDLIAKRKHQFEKLDLLVKSKFVEMFGDLKLNPMNWDVEPFHIFARFDCNMTTDYEKYADYPHIGIDSIEKETGRSTGYRTVKEDGVISGKYVFSPEHIIYSKIRPNLNKVALPEFYGLCSADAYPILVNNQNCNRYFLAMTMRSKCFLDYILQFCNRTNLPKVNKKEISGFKMPLPPIELQNQFAEFVKQTDQIKRTINQSLDKLEILKMALMQEYFG